LDITKKTVLSLMLVMITILTTLTLTTTIATAYAGGGDDDNRDGNKQKAEDDSAAAIADCDDNDVERAGFDCIAIATNDVEIEPPSEESAILSVCKEVRQPLGSGFSPGDFDFTVTGNDPFPDEFEGSANCVDVDIGPGEYTVTEVSPPLGGRTLTVIIGGDCIPGPGPGPNIPAIGEIQAGETQTCTFINSIGD
jgi:hypothetical protein